eukprot:1458719-Prymnesium_polylepis.1
MRRALGFVQSWPRGPVCAVSSVRAARGIGCVRCAGALSPRPRVRVASQQAAHASARRCSIARARPTACGPCDAR